MLGQLQQRDRGYGVLWREPFDQLTILSATEPWSELLGCQEPRLALTDLVASVRIRDEVEKIKSTSLELASLRLGTCGSLVLLSCTSNLVIYFLLKIFGFRNNRTEIRATINPTGKISMIVIPNRKNGLA